MKRIGTLFIHTNITVACTTLLKNRLVQTTHLHEYTDLKFHHSPSSAQALRKIISEIAP